MVGCLQTTVQIKLSIRDPVKKNPKIFLTPIQEAANFLNISRLFLIQLLEKEKIPFRKVGRHRRILFEDLLNYKKRSRAKGRKIREQLTDEAQDLDIGY